MTLQLILLGKFALLRDGELIDLRNKKAQALLIYMSLTGKSHTREHLAALLWGDRFDDQARRSLRQSVFALRKVIGTEVLVGESELMLQPGTIIVDVVEFKNTCKAGEEYQDGYLGDLLPEFRVREETFDDWLTAEREQYHQIAHRAFTSQAEHLFENGDPSRALKLAETALGIEPLNEDTLRLTMHLLARLDRRANAIALFEKSAETLKQELDVEPALETVKLAAGLRLPQTAAASDASMRSFEHGKLRSSIVIAPFEDDGGGEIASFLARDIAPEMLQYMKKSDFLSTEILRLLPVSTEQKTSMDLAREIDAFALISGNVRQIGDMIRVSTKQQVVQSGEITWSRSITIKSDQAFELLNNVSQIMKSDLYYFLDSSYFLSHLKPSNFDFEDDEAFVDRFSQSFWAVFFGNHTRAGMQELEQFSEKALKTHPSNSFLLLYTALASFHATQLGDGKNRVAGYELALDYLRRALAITPNSNMARQEILMFSNWVGRFEDVEHAYQSMKEDGQSVPSMEGLLGTSYMFRGRNEEAIERVQQTIRLESGAKFLMYRYPIVGLSYFNMSDFDKAELNASNGLEVGQEFFLNHLVRIAALQRLGRQNDAVQAIAEFQEAYRDPTLSEFAFLPFSQEEPKQNFLNALRDAGLPE